MVLEKKIHSPADMRAWIASQSYQDLVSFVQSVSQHVTSKPIVKGMATSQGIQSVTELLQQLEKRIETFPAEEQPQRFGNKAFRSWFNWLKANAADLCKCLLFDKNGITAPTISDLSFEEAIAEVAGYLIESVGNATRIDYGTGHELAFIAFLFCLFKLGVLQIPALGASKTTLLNDYAAVGLVVMPVYLHLVRRLQVYYRMEPAGSHGVWCLDDFQFVPFIWGSSQLIGSDQYGPSSISDRQIAETEKDRNLLFSCIDYIYQVKTGPFAEHSPTLYGICQVPYWEKVQSGLVKMYKGEVLDKYPVVQHFLFGHILTLNRSATQSGPSPGNLSFPHRTPMPPPPPPVSPRKDSNSSPISSSQAPDTSNP
ncbi:phosphotyrosyl phosphate activator protein, partial [Opisthorchis viverrini]|uniref:Serine/threonine-protein phosphatase 2A activator n=2 Tax=Opisthorchis viverrini TaxID=6198 RepID=A0A074Z8H2_OPIVI